MSQHQLIPRDPRHDVTIGWDPGLANFFLQVLDRKVKERNEDEDPFIVWLGADGYDTEPDVNPVLEEAERWAFIPRGLRISLLTDHKREGTRPRPRLLFTGSGADTV